MSSEINKVSWDDVFDVQIESILTSLRNISAHKGVNTNYLFTSFRGGGKTTLLGYIHDHISSAEYMDWGHNAVKTTRYHVIIPMQLYINLLLFSNIKSMLTECAKFLSKENTIFLIDNIDEILVHPRKANLPSRYLASAIINLIDDCRRRGSIIVATSSDTDNIHPSMLQPYRFELLSIPGPSAAARKQFIRYEIQKIFASANQCQPSSEGSEIYNEMIESATRKLSFGDLHNIVDRCILDLRIRSALISKLLQLTAKFTLRFDELCVF
jgi:hypothetical protein